MKYATSLQPLARAAIFLGLIFIGGLTFVQAQTATFTYQGRLTDANNPSASGTYKMQFALYDDATAADAGNLLGTVTLNTVAVTGGIFTVQLSAADFGANAFNGAARWIEVRVFSPSSASFVTLAPRQAVSSSPYALRSISASVSDALSSACAGCVTDANIDSLDGSKITGTVANSQNAVNAQTLGGAAASNFVQTSSAAFIRNQTAQQTGNFNVSGNGTLGGTLAAAKVAITGGVIARGGDPGGFGVNNNGYSFGGGGDNDGGLFSTADGRVSLYTDSVERLRVNGTGDVAIGAVEPTEKLDVRGNIKLGGAGDLFAPGAPENLRFLRGGIQVSGGTPTIASGTGFTVNRQQAGVYQIFFSQPFNGTPTLIASASSNVTLLANVAFTNNSTATVVVTTNTTNSFTDPTSLTFIAVGPR